MIFRALLFDFNGLIIDDEPIHCLCAQKALEPHGITLTDRDYWDIYLGFDDRGLFEEIYKRDGKKITPKKLKELIDAKHRRYVSELEKNCRFFPGVIEFIREIKKNHLLAIVSGALRSEIDLVLAKAELARTFQVVVSAEETKHGKPDPEGFMIALAKLKKNNPEVRPENCLVLEDSHAGIEAAKRVGMKTAALAHTYPKEQFGDADFVVEKFEELWDHLGR